MLILDDKNNGHNIKYRKFLNSHYYFYKNSNIEFHYPEKLIYGNDSFRYVNKKHFVLKIEKMKNGIYDITLFGFYKNGSLLKKRNNSINGKISKSIHLNSTFVLNSLDHFNSIIKKYKIISPVSFDKNIYNYNARLNFWKKIGFHILKKDINEYIIKLYHENFKHNNFGYLDYIFIEKK